MYGHLTTNNGAKCWRDAGPPDRARERGGETATCSRPQVSPDTPDGEPNTDAVVDLNEAFYTVVTSQLNSHSLLFSAEIDGRVTDLTVPPPTCYVEMKTNKSLRNLQDKSNLYRKLQTCWVQSFLVGVPKIVFGFRDDKRVVGNVECYSTSDIPGMATGHGSAWKASDCMNFCDKFLSYVQRCATKDDASVVYLFQRVGQNVTCEEYSGPPYKFLPDWYTDAV
ncbi:hypothetical protein Bbelb_311100 [Branchiostoma belcheri]|nr:hypothetical protein Bbelb_311100 [Branchiostoma belcheri]